MEIFLQIWGGLFYLFAKIFLSRSEGPQINNKLKLIGWIVYLIGVPAWVIILSINHNWIAVSVEAGGVMAIILGIFLNIKNKKNRLVPKYLDNFVKFLTFTLLILGISYSVYVFNGITTIKQILEIGIMAGFLIGTYLLAKNNSFGWLWFILMNLCMGTLMAIQNNLILTMLQIISLYFVISGFLKSRYFLESSSTLKLKKEK